MNRNTTGLLLGCVGAAMTVLAYQQTVVSSTQCIGAGLAVLVCALCIKEGFFSF
ncbi:uncharacterized protein LOC123426918 [Hordeum vulgare subsp. vulgare]|uniref:uncharacterized protein LOC123426918 n=1 Tax=Hordeum vulgare subsp. vulgare TaxID=112509 RepID=UPI000B480931|nr:uncharacterized protein LOC123426918 [Hordeum vulgare subsp. vulgare]